VRKIINVLALGLAAGVASATILPPLSVYTKLKSNTFGSWQQESGLSTVLKTQGKFSLGANLAVVTKWPYHNENGVQYTSGLTLRYRVAASDDSLATAIYTKVKYDLFHTWQQETGVAANLWHQGPWTLGFNAGFLYTYPIIVHDKAPSYTIGFTLTRKL
jgi:hypothetical protein